MAGRCKHCKTDLVKLREARGVRAPRLDPASLGVMPVAMPSPFAPAPTAALAGATAAPRLDATPMPVPAAPGLPMALGDGELIEPAPLPRKSRWPVIVAILAGVAIVVCLALLLGGGEPARASGGGKRSSGGGMPAPDRMDTMPAPPVPAPMQPAPDLKNPFADPDPDPAPDPSDPFSNPFNKPNPPPTPPRGAVPSAEEFSEAVIQHGCDRLKSCGMDQAVGMICGMADTLGLADYTKELVQSGRCTYDSSAAGECLAAIDGFQCSGGTLDFDQLSKTFLSIGSCARALSCH